MTSRHAISVWLAIAASCSSEQADTERRFVALTIDDADRATGRFETACAKYLDERQREVTLVAAVHYAESRCYTELQSRLAEFEVVLFELFSDSDAGTVVPPAHPSDRAILELGLVRQLDCIDYTLPSFVKADSGSRAIESLTGIDVGAPGFRRTSGLPNRLPGEGPAPIFRVTPDGKIETADGKPVDLAALQAAIASQPRQPLVFGPERTRLAFAQRLVDPDGWTPKEREFLGADDLSLQLEPEWEAVQFAREQEALKTLDDQLGAGRRNIAVLYGAAHMPNLERGLVARGFRRIGTEWIVAWRIK